MVKSVMAGWLVSCRLFGGKNGGWSIGRGWKGDQRCADESLRGCIIEKMSNANTVTNCVSHRTCTRVVHRRLLDFFDYSQKHTRNQSPRCSQSHYTYLPLDPP